MALVLPRHARGREFGVVSDRCEDLFFDHQMFSPSSPGLLLRNLIQVTIIAIYSIF